MNVCRWNILLERCAKFRMSFIRNYKRVPLCIAASEWGEGERVLCVCVCVFLHLVMCLHSVCSVHVII